MTSSESLCKCPEREAAGSKRNFIRTARQNGNCQGRESYKIRTTTEINSRKGIPSHKLAGSIWPTSFMCATVQARGYPEPCHRPRSMQRNRDVTTTSAGGHGAERDKSFSFLFFLETKNAARSLPCSLCSLCGSSSTFSSMD